MTFEEITQAIKDMTATDKASAEALIKPLKAIVQAATDQICNLAIEHEIHYVTMGNLSLDLGAGDEIKGLIEDADGNWCDPKSGEIWYYKDDYDEMESRKGQWLSSSAYC